MSEQERSTAARLLGTLEALSAAPDGMTGAEVARALGKDKSSVSRQLRPLVDLGVVERDSDGRHRLGWRFFTLAARAGDQRLLLLAPPVMRQLSNQLAERVHLSVLRGRDVLTILSESSQRSIEAVGWVGRTAPVHCTSSGRALLFDHSDEAVRALLDGLATPGPGPQAPKSVDEFLRRLREARQSGFATADGEFDPDLVAAAAPVRDFTGRIIATLNVSAPAYRLRGRLWQAGQHVAAAATHLSRAISSEPGL
ncbi:IclR family transcriptional regulator [Actinokineospora sp.]|uniref:IclR family transcriptional regulator n=1 Tax=Actinokineospora sp. TaxID=1872133 RepID=UPI004037DD7A